MLFKTKGLVLREVKVGEADKILTLLTPANGIISVSAKGSMRPKNKLFSASGLFAYSEWVLFDGKTMASANEAAPIELFFDLRQNLEAVALGAYIADVLQIISPAGAEAAGLLRLALNSLHVLSKGKSAPRLIKAVFEFRTLKETGFMPDVLECVGCGCDSNNITVCRLEVGNGKLYCEKCAKKHSKTINLDQAAYAALQHILYADIAQIFNFDLKNASLINLYHVAEAFLLFNIGYRPKTLDFLASLLLGTE